MPPKRDVVRAERTMSRAGIWATTHVQLTLPLDAHGLSELIRANGRLRITPDFDVFAYLCEGYLRDQDSEGWVPFTLYDLGWSVYGREPSFRERRELLESLRRMRSVHVELLGYDAQTGQMQAITRRRTTITDDNLIDRIVSEFDEDKLGAREIGALRGSTFKVQLPPWLRQQLEQGTIARVHWPTLSKFGANQQLAKRLFIYLSAERWARASEAHEQTAIVLGDRLFTALGMNYSEATKSRLYLKRAAETVARLDNRMVSAEIQTRRAGARGRVGSYMLCATRLTKEALKAQGDLLLPLDPQTERQRRKIKRAIAIAEKQRRSTLVRQAVGELDAD